MVPVPVKLANEEMTWLKEVGPPAPQAFDQDCAMDLNGPVTVDQTCPAALVIAPVVSLYQADILS